MIRETRCRFVGVIREMRCPLFWQMPDNKQKSFAMVTALLLLFPNYIKQQQQTDIVLAFRMLPIHNAFA
jgi:hypothetical protein